MNRFKELRKKSGMTQTQLAARLKVNQTAVSQWERALTSPSHEALLALSEIFGVSLDYLLGRKSGATVNVYGTVPAGIPMEAIEDVIDTEEIPSEWLMGGKMYFGLKVRGDSMFPKYMDGDTIIVKKQSNCESGDDCVVYVNGYEATLKKVLFIDNGGLQLVPLNSNYPPISFSRKEVSELPVMIAGVVVEIRRKVGTFI